jgi:hypothetical protein
VAQEGSAYEILESVDGELRGLADLDEVAVRIAHATTQFVAVVIEGLGEELSAFLRPISVAGANVCDAQIEEADQLARGLPPPSRCPCWAHMKVPAN